VVHGPAASAAWEAGAKQETSGRDWGKDQAHGGDFFPRGRPWPSWGAFRAPGVHLLPALPDYVLQRWLVPASLAVTLLCTVLPLNHHGSFPRSSASLIWLRNGMSCLQEKKMPHGTEIKTELTKSLALLKFVMKSRLNVNDTDFR